MLFIVGVCQHPSLKKQIQVIKPSPFLYTFFILLGINAHISSRMGTINNNIHGTSHLKQIYPVIVWNRGFTVVYWQNVGHQMSFKSPPLKPCVSSPGGPHKMMEGFRGAEVPIMVIVGRSSEISKSNGLVSWVLEGDKGKTLSRWTSIIIELAETNLKKY